MNQISPQQKQELKPFKQVSSILIMLIVYRELHYFQMKSKDNIKKISKYQIDYSTMLGRGGMASVYLGYYAEGEGNPDIRFAVKEISINSSFVATDSLLQEINLLRKINHPFILKYVDAKKSHSCLYLILQFCDGGTLQDEMSIYDQGLPEGVLKKYIAQLMIALKYLKQQKIIHRDIKPKNILIHQGNLKLSDFGVAKMINQHNFDKQTTTFSGTIQFMSPQILKQDKYTFQTDIWSTGISIYYMIFRKMPWSSGKVLGILSEIEKNGGVIVPEQGISPQLRDLLQRMLVEDEEIRITVEEILKHQFLKETIEQQFKQIDLEQMFTPTEITKDQFIITNNPVAKFAQHEIDVMARRCTQVRSSFRTSQLTIDRARQAYRKLTNFKQQILFFKQILNDLRYYHHQKKNSLFNVDLFKKCEFLLVKRSYVIANDLHQILLFGVHTQGNIMIPKADFNQLIDETKITNTYIRVLRDEVGRLYEDCKNDWLETKEQFYDHQRRFGIKIIPREDAYLESLIENKNLILAFNDCFLELFMTLSKGIVEDHSNTLSEPIVPSNIVFNYGVNLQFLYDLMILLCFPKISETGNMKAYQNKKKHVSCQQFIYRIQTAYKCWRGHYQSFTKKDKINN